jgi:hypothetical protein
MTHPIFYILDDDGEPVPSPDPLTAAVWWATADPTIFDDQPVTGVEVSTVFLSIDHSHRADGRPVLWETMIFGGVFDQYQRRYTSKLDALTGHAWAVRLVETYATAPRRLKKAMRPWRSAPTRSRNIRRRLRKALA